MGYDVTRFTEQPDGEFLCSICLGVFEDPVQGSCGHVYCSVCIKNWLIPGLPTYQVDQFDNQMWNQPEAVNGMPIPDGIGAIGGPNFSLPPPPRQVLPNVNPRSSCPLDKKPLSRTSLTPIPLPLKGLLYKLEIKCAFDTCTHRCALSEIGSHELVCEFNPSSEVTCPKCSRKMVRSERLNHDCIEVLKGIVERLEREVERLKKKRRFPTPFNAGHHHNHPVFGHSPSSSSVTPAPNSNTSFAGQPIQMGGQQPGQQMAPLPLPPPNLFSPFNNQQPSPSQHIVHRPMNFRSVMPSINNSVIRRSGAIGNHGHGLHPYHSRSPHTPPRIGDNRLISPRSSSETRHRPINMRDVHRQQFLEGLPSDPENDLDMVRGSRTQTRQLRVIPSLPVPITTAGPSNIGQPSPRNSISGHNNSNHEMNNGHHQIVAIGGQMPRTYTISSDADVSHDVILFNN